MSEAKWTLFDEKEPANGDQIWVAFYYPSGALYKKGYRCVRLCCYTPKYIVPLCEEDEGDWKGMGSVDCDAAFAWKPRERGPAYPTELEKHVIKEKKA